MKNSFFDNIRVPTKLFGLATGMIVLMLVLAAIAYLGLQGQKTALRDLYERRFQAYQQSSRISDAVLAANAHIYKVVNMINLEKQESEIDKEIDHFMDSLKNAQALIVGLGHLDQAVLSRQSKNLKSLKTALTATNAQMEQIRRSLAAKGTGPEESSPLSVEEQESFLCSRIYLGISNYGLVIQDVMPTVKIMKDIGGEMAAGMMAGTETDFQELMNSLQTLNDFERVHAEQSYNHAGVLSVRSVSLFITTVVVAVILSLSLSLIIVRGITGPLRRTVRMIKELEKGHLNVRLSLSGTNEISQMAQAMDAFAEDLKTRVLGVNAASGELVNVSENLSKAAGKVDDSAQAQAKGVHNTGKAVHEIGLLISDVAEGVAVLTSSTAESTSSVLEMSASNEELAGNVEQLAGIVEEVGSSMTEMATSIQQVAENTGVLKDASDTTASSVAQMDASFSQVEQSIKETAQITDAVRLDAEEGKATVETTIAGINEIRQASRITSEAISSLSEKVRNIGNILSMIDDVTDQTSLLALNAAIIAAQAGEHGKGFAVVSEEIRELSDRTSASTREIAEVVANVQKETQRVVQAIDRSEKSVAEGERLSRSSGEALTKIVRGIQEVDQRMERIAKATLEQSQGSRAIHKAMEKVAHMVDQTAGATREQSKAARDIMAAVEQMKGLTIQVKTSTREQSNGSKVIASAMEDINEMIKKINLACEEQTSQSDQIRIAVQDINRFAEENLESTRILQDAISKQDHQINILKKEMGSFRVVG